MNSAEMTAMKGAVGARLEEKGEYRRMDGEMASLYRRVGKLEMQSKIVMKTAGVRPDAKDRDEDIIAFTAQLTDHTMVKGKDRLPFDDVMVNVGDAYDRAAKEFVAPYNGLYLFALTVRAAYHKKVCAELVGRNIVVARVSSGYGGIERATGTVSVVLQLGTGDQVFARQISDESIGEYHGHGCTVLAGVMIAKFTKQ